MPTMVTEAPPTFREIGEMQAAVGRFGPEHVTHPLRQVAQEYLASYRGNFRFLSDVAYRMRRYPLSAAQIAGTLNCIAAEARRRAQAEQPRQEGAGPFTQRTGTVEQVVPNGTYTVVFDGNEADYVTLRMRAPWEGLEGYAPGTQVAQYFRGSDNEAESAYAGFAFIQGNTIIPWRRHAGAERQHRALRMLLTSSDPAAMGLTYAMRSERCWRCNRRLTVPASLHRGVGPECAEILGMTTRRGAVSVAPPVPAQVPSEFESEDEDAADKYTLEE